MARSRNRTQNDNDNSNTNTTQGERTMSALTADFITELLAGARTKGAGDDVLTAFLESGEQGIEVDLESGPLAGKTAAQASTALNNAKKRTKANDSGETVIVHPAAAQVQVVKRKDKDGNEHVFLIDKAKLG